MNSKDYYQIEKAINFLEENYKSQPSLEEVASYLNLSPFHFQRIFKRFVGITPKKFLQLLTLENIKKNLESNSYLDVTFDSGLSSTSRTHELFVNLEAISPKEFKNRGKNTKILYGVHQTPFGPVFLAITKKGIIALSFLENINDEESALSNLKSKWINASFEKNEKQTDEIIKEVFSKNKKINLLVRGTNFQIKVWKALLEIPEGRFKTYEDIAKRINHPKALRAVGTAVRNNPISYLIPCHRVIRKSGVLGNYRWGKNRKKIMIGYELSKELKVKS